MARIAGAICGTSTTIPPTDWRVMLPPGVSAGMVDTYPSTYFTLPAADGRDLFWKVKTVQMDYDFTTSAGHFVGSSAEKLPNPSPSDERSLDCATSATFSLSAAFTFDFGFYGFDGSNPASPKFIFSWSAGGADISSNPAAGTPSAIVVTILGQSVQLYDTTGGGSGSISVAVVDYWPYDDGVTYDPVTAPFSGVIWDATDDHQILFPVPISLYGP